MVSGSRALIDGELLEAMEVGKLPGERLEAKGATRQCLRLDSPDISFEELMKLLQENNCECQALIFTRSHSLEQNASRSFR